MEIFKTQQFKFPKVSSVIVIPVAFLVGFGISQLRQSDSVKPQARASDLETSKSMAADLIPSKNSTGNPKGALFANDEPYDSENAFPSILIFEDQVLVRCEIEQILSEFRRSGDFNPRAHAILEESERGESKYRPHEILQTLVPLLRKSEELESFFATFPTEHPSWGKLLNEIVVDSAGRELPSFPSWLTLHITSERLRHAKAEYSYALSLSFQGTPQEVVTTIDFTMDEQVDAFGRFLARQGSPEDRFTELDIETIAQSSRNRLLSSMATELGRRDPESALLLLAKLPNDYYRLQNRENEAWANWAEISPEAALSAVETYARSSKSSDAATRSIAIRWYVKEPAGMISWLQESEGGRARDLMIYEIMQDFPLIDKPSRQAALDLVNSISTPQIRSNAFRSFERTYKE